MNKNIIGHLLAFFTVFVWSTTFVSSKIILQYMTPGTACYNSIFSRIYRPLGVQTKAINYKQYKKRNLFYISRTLWSYTLFLV